MTADDIRIRRRATDPSPTLRASLSRVDWSDSFAVDIPRGLPTEPEFWRRQLFAGRPRDGLVDLMAIRNRLAVRIGLEAVGTSAARTRAFPVISSSAAEVVVGLDDRHLDFRVSLTVAATATGAELVVTTVVRRHNLLGRTYFLVVRGPHRLLVPRWTRTAVRRVQAGECALPDRQERP